jgi:hypothetical protein
LNRRRLLDVNAKNSEGFTAVDIAVDNQDMRNMLWRCAGEKRASFLHKPFFNQLYPQLFFFRSSLLKVDSWADYFISPVTINEKFFILSFV